MRPLLLIVLLVFNLGALAGPLLTEVIQLQSRPAFSLIDTVRPMLGKGSGVSAFHDRLIVQGTPGEIAAVRQLISQLDRPVRRLLIEVRQGGQASMSTQQFGYGVNSGDVRLGRVPPGYRGQISYQNLQTRGQGDSLQRVQALDGQPAFVRAGQSIPVYNAQQQIIGNTVVQGFTMQYRDTGTGFYAVPHVHGDQVTVEIHQQHSRPLTSGRFAEQQASTILRGRLGQWLTLAATGDADSDRGDQLGRHVTTQRSQDRRLELRVMPID